MSLSIEELAEDKGLPPDFLKGLGVREYDDSVLIPYFDEEGNQADRHRIRTDLEDGFRWTSGSKEPILYGLKYLDHAREEGYCVFVEGETDCWSCWYSSIPALGFPGANTYDKLQEQHLEGVETLLVHREPDQGGNEFVQGVKERLVDLEWTGYVSTFTAKEL